MPALSQTAPGQAARSQGTSARARGLRRTQAARRAESDRRMLQAAAELVVERGIEGASLAEIGRRAGYSHGLVHSRFGSKEGLLDRLEQAALQLFAEAGALQLGQARGLEALHRVASIYLDLVQGPDPVARVHLVVWGEAAMRVRDRQEFRLGLDRYFRSLLAQMIRDGQADGTVRPDVEPDGTAVVVAGLLRGIALQVMIDPGAASERTGDAVRRHLTRMLAP